MPRDSIPSPNVKPDLRRQRKAELFDGHSFHPTLLREYDIRGVIGQTLDISDARAVGRVFGRMVARRGKTAAVGYDGRHSSPALEDALVGGLRDSGVEVLRIGLGPTPMLYFAVHHLAADGGAMVTGSHNPPDHNGLKLVLGSAPVFGSQIRELGRMAAEPFFPAATCGRVSSAPVFDAYIERIARDYDGQRPLAVAWDAGNGAAGEALRALTAHLPGRHVLLNTAIDGDFPAHHPDPTVAKNLIQLQETVRRERCDLGIAFDGDGDRIGIVDERGRILWGDQIMTLLARDVLSRHPGSTIIADVKASQVLFDEIRRSGGVPLMWKSGHSLLRSKLAELGSPLAGEMSGHVFFADRFYGHDDALYVAVRFLGMVSRSGRSLGSMRDGFPQPVNTPELRFPYPDDEKFAAVERVKSHLISSGIAIVDIDGARVTTPDGWWLLRASNTESVLVARCEAWNEEALLRVKRGLSDALRAAGVEAPDL